MTQSELNTRLNNFLKLKMQMAAIEKQLEPLKELEDVYKKQLEESMKKLGKTRVENEFGIVDEVKRVTKGALDEKRIAADLNKKNLDEYRADGKVSTYLKTKLKA